MIAFQMYKTKNKNILKKLKIKMIFRTKIRLGPARPLNKALGDSQFLYRVSRSAVCMWRSQP